MVKNKKNGRRSIGLLWMLAVVIVIGAMISYEQIALLYVLATLAIVALLLIVGFADLEGVGRNDGENAGSSV